VKKEDFERAEMFTVFTGPVDEGEIIIEEHEWDLFGISGGAVAADVRREALRLGIQLAHDIEGFFLEPEMDSEFALHSHDDHDAALAYIANGGRLVKLPDAMGSKYYRLYPVVAYRPDRHATEPAPPPEHSLG
jgi:hypothetical protein